MSRFKIGVFLNVSCLCSALPCGSAAGVTLAREMKGVVVYQFMQNSPFTELVKGVEGGFAVLILSACSDVAITFKEKMLTMYCS